MEMIITLKDGFEAQLVDKYLPIEKAKGLMLARPNCFYRASNNGIMAKLSSCYVVCPRCGNRQKSQAVDERISKRSFRQAIEGWSDQQLEINPRKRELVFGRPITTGRFCCERCGHQDDIATKEHNVTIQSSDGVVSVESDANFLLLLKNIKQLSLLKSPVREKMVFNLREGSITHELKDAAGRVVTRDITRMLDCGAETSLAYYIDQNCVLKKKLFRIFKKTYAPYTLYFRENECSLIKLFLSTRFLGFDSLFYDCIPFTDDTMRLDDSFEERAKELCNIETAIRAYENSILPKTRAIMELFTNTPGILFYLAEIEILYEMMGTEKNRLMAVLKSPKVWDVLSYLHRFPGAKNFFFDFTAVRGGAVTKRVLVEHFDEAKAYAIEYSCLSKSLREREKTKWRSKNRFGFPSSPYRVPMRQGAPYLDDEIMGFTFKRLVVKDDYLKCGKALNNCLVDWTPEMTPVVGILRSGKYIAALEIEVSGGSSYVRQARIKDNDPIIHGGERLYLAFREWLNRKSLVFQERQDFDAG